MILSLITNPLSPKIKSIQLHTVHANVSKLSPPLIYRYNKLNQGFCLRFGNIIHLFTILASYSTTLL